MCLVFAFVALAFSIDAFYKGAFLAGVTAATVALFFLVLVYRNIISAKRIQKEKRIEKEKNIDH
jgi:preprotein translocase subunit SecG